MQPPAEGFAARLVVGPALRAQPDRRLVALVRDGYELAFEEIVRRYGKALGRYAGAIVGERADDVTQDAFSKALLALRRDGAEIELRPWLFRIVRNTALNDLRDSPPSPELLAEAIAGGRNPAEELERREELTDLMRRLQSLPEPQRAAIVMRELEGLSHEEIAGALGLSGGGARQAIYRARQALREGLGMLLPLPLLRLLIDHGGDAAAVAASTSGAAAAGGAGGGMLFKAGALTAVLAGSVGTGIALHDHSHPADDATRGASPGPITRAITSPPSAVRASGTGPDALAERHDQGGSSRSGPDHGGGSGGNSDDSNHGQGTPEQSFAPGGGPGPSSPAHEHHGQQGSGNGERGEPLGGREDGRDKHDGGGNSHSGPGGGSREGDQGEQGHGGEQGGSDGGGSGESASGGGHGGRHGPDGEGSSSTEPSQPPPPAEEALRGGEDGSGSGSSGSGSSHGSGSSEDSGRNDELP